MISWWDSLRNLVTGLGTFKDPTTSSEFYLQVLTRHELESAYRSDWVARKIVDAPAEDCTREWRSWQATNSQIEAIEAIEKAHGLQEKVKRAMIRGRLYGGGAIVMGVNDGRMPDEELDLERVGKDSLRFAVVLNRWELNAGPRIYDVESPWYTRPAYYTVATPMYGFSPEGGPSPRAPANYANGSEQVSTNEKEMMARWAGMVRIHPSRVVEFTGNELPDWRLAPMGGGWGDSVLQTAFDTLKDLGLVVGGTAAMVNDSKMDVIRIPNLSKTLANKDYAAKLIERFTLSNQAKSMVNTLLLDKEEEWERITTSFAGIPPLIHEFLTIMAGAGSIPLSRLFGESKSQGLGESGGVGGGSSDLRNYYDSQASYQKTTLTPILNPLDQVLIRSALGSFKPNVHYEWDSLWQLGEDEKAKIAYQNAQATQIYVQLGIFNEQLMAEAVSNQLIEDGIYPGLETLIETYGLEPEQITSWSPSASAASVAGGPQPRQIEASEELKDSIVPRIGLARNPPGVPFRCGACEYFKDGRCTNDDPDLKGREVDPITMCCDLFDHPGMHRIVDTDTRQAAGVIFQDPDGAMLFTRRAGADDPHAGEWCIPAGMCEQDEEPMRAAQREAAEEVGHGGDHRIEHLETRESDELTFHTFVQPVAAQFEPLLNDEHDAHTWRLPSQPPLPLHPGLASTLRRHFGSRVGVGDTRKTGGRRTRAKKVKSSSFADLADALRQRTVDEDPPEEPRDDHGRWTSGGGGGEPAKDLKIFGSGPHHDEIRQAVNSIPQSHLKYLQGVTFVGTKQLTNRSGEFREGQHGENDRIVIASEGRSGAKIYQNIDVFGTTLHEIGHAIDTRGDFSKKLEPIFNSDTQKLDAGERHAAKYWLLGGRGREQILRGGRREMFAEMYKLAYSPRKTGAFNLGQKRAEHVFSNSIAAIKKILGE